MSRKIVNNAQMAIT